MSTSRPKSHSALGYNKNNLIGMKRDELLKGVTVEIGKPDIKLMEAERAFGNNRSQVAQSALQAILRIQDARR
ncbi:hypothetical protein [Glutamicibacter sp. NPDC087344]|uniref:hypothetical protein n=1 Tax=Glutamicibacter sp. NPDC087344 TaxID=3363994 RepID=UPI0037F22209